MTTPREPGPAPAEGSSPRRTIVLTLVVSVVYLWLRAPAPPLALDTIHDYLLARGCWEDQGCWGHTASMSGLTHGRLLSFVLGPTLGLGPLVHHALFIVYLAAAVAIVVRLAIAELGERAAVEAGAIALLAWVATAEYPTLWHPSLMSLPLAVFALALTRIVDGRRAWVFVAAAAVVVAYNGHIAHAVLLPVLLAVIATSIPSLGVGLSLGLGAGLIVIALIAVDAPVFMANVRAISPPMRAAIAAGLIAAWLGGRWLAPRFTALPLARRRRLVVLGLSGAIVAAIVVISIVADHEITPRYWAAAVPGLVILTTGGLLALAERGRGWAIAIRACLTVLLLAPVVVEFWFVTPSMQDARTFARRWAERGASLRVLLDHYRGPYRRRTIEAARIWMPLDPGEPTAGASDVRVLPWPTLREPPPGWTRWSSGVRSGLIASEDPTPWIAMAQPFTACWGREPEPGARTCATIDDGVRWIADPFLTGDSHASTIEITEPVTWHSQRLRVTIASASPRSIVTNPGWEVVEVIGLDHAIEHAGRVVEISGPVGATGELVVRVQLGERDSWVRAPAYPEISIELDAAESALIEDILGLPEM